MFVEGVEYARAEVTRGSADTDDPNGVGDHCDDEFDDDHDEETYRVERDILFAGNKANADTSPRPHAHANRTAQITS
jgi:hypothetical protein